MTDRDRQLLELVEEVRAEMNARLDALAAAIRAGEGELEAPKKKPPKRRAPLRPPVASGPVLLTDDIARKKAQIALQRMGLVKVRG